MKIDSIQLCTIGSTYNVFFERYNDKIKTKGKKTTQLIPTKVWVDVYDMYKSKFPDSSFTQVHLKERLRETLKDIGTGNSNEALSEKAQMQSAKVLEKIQKGKKFCARNLHHLRREFVVGNTHVNAPPIPTPPAPVPAPTSSSDTECINLSSPGSPPVPDAPAPTAPKVSRPTKAASLANQSFALASMAEEMKVGRVKRDKLLEAKLIIKGLV
ncbi:unnamed protein product [Calypogeia fissa]